MRLSLCNGIVREKETWTAKCNIETSCDASTRLTCSLSFLLPQIFREINAINSLKKAASSPFAVASRFAAMALKSLGELVPHKLSQQVALWTINDVKEWIKQVRIPSVL